MTNEVAIVIEHLKGTISDVTFELIGKGRELADGLSCNLVAILLGHSAKDLSNQLGTADRVVYVDDPVLAQYSPDAYRKVLSALLKERQPRVVVLPNTSIGMDLSAPLSAELEIPLVAYCKGITVENNSLCVTSQLYGGKINVDSCLESGQAILSVLAGSFPVERGRSNKTPVVEEIKSPVPLDQLRVRFKNLIEPDASGPDITKEEKLVSIGRGIQSQDNIELAQQLADALGATISASRPIIDNGWLPKSRQVGKSGMTVKPKLYLAVGISGAPEHLEGMKDADLIIAVNTDPKAPIFDIADYGIVGDLFEIIPALTEKVKSAKG